MTVDISTEGSSDPGDVTLSILLRSASPVENDLLETHTVEVVNRDGAPLKPVIYSDVMALGAERVDLVHLDLAEFVGQCMVRVTAAVQGADGAAQTEAKSVFLDVGSGAVSVMEPADWYQDPPSTP